MLWASDPATEIGVYTGWGGAGLLGLVLSWLLLKHLPELDRARKEERADFIKALEDQRKELAAAMTDQRKDFAAILLRQEEKFERNLDKLVEQFRAANID